MRLARRMRRAGGRVIRRLGLLPDGDPDGLGDDDALRGQSLPFQVMVYFPDTLRNLYQLRQWYRAAAGARRAAPGRHRLPGQPYGSGGPAGVPTFRWSAPAGSGRWRTWSRAATSRSRCT